MTKILQASLSASLLLLGMGQALAAKPEPIKGQLSMVCSANKEWCDLLSKKYEEEFNVTLTSRHMATNEALEKIRAAKANPEFDVWFGGTGDPHLGAAAEDLTLSYRSPHLKDLHDWAVRQATISNYKTVGVYSGMLGFIVNEDELKKKNIKAPRCWGNLQRREYAGQILSSNPATSGTGYTMVATLVSMMGEEQAYMYMKQLNPSIKEYAKSGSSLVPRVAKGEWPIAIGFMHDGVREKLNGAPVKVISPCEGTGYETGSVSIIKGGDAKEAKRFVDWVLTPRVQEFGVETKQFQLPSNVKTPIPTGAPRFSEFKIYLAYDAKKFAMPEEKKRLTARWEKEVLQDKLAQQ